MQTLTVPCNTANVELYRCSVADRPILSDWLDVYLQGNYFFRHKHLEGILARDTSAVFAILVDGCMAGVAVIYKGSVLHNLYLSPDHRQQGIGRAVLAFLKPQSIRSKSDQKEGDPTPFYQANGYQISTIDENRPHIRNMVPAGVQPMPAGLPAAHQATPAAPPLPQSPQDQAIALAWDFAIRQQHTFGPTSTEARSAWGKYGAMVAAAAPPAAQPQPVGLAPAPPQPLAQQGPPSNLSPADQLKLATINKHEQKRKAYFEKKKQERMEAKRLASYAALSAQQQQQAAPHGAVPGQPPQLAVGNAPAGHVQGGAPPAAAWDPFANTGAD